MNAPKAVASKFQIPESEPMLQLNRVRLANAQPVAVEYAYLNPRMFPELEQKNFEAHLLFDPLRQRYGMYPAWAGAEIEARIATEDERNWLNMQPGQAVLVAHRLTFTETFDLIEMVDSIYPGHRFPIYIGR